MKKTMIIAALAASALLPAYAQLYTPTAQEAKQAHDNAMRDARLADAMEKARLKEEARPVSAYIPKEKAQPAIESHKPEVFMARVPGEKKKAAKKKT